MAFAALGLFCFARSLAILHYGETPGTTKVEWLLILVVLCVGLMTWLRMLPILAGMLICSVLTVDALRGFVEYRWLLYLFMLLSILLIVYGVLPVWRRRVATDE